MGLRAVTYSYLTRLKAAATREGLSLSKPKGNQPERGRGGERDGDKEIQRYSKSQGEWNENSGEDFLQSSLNHLSERKSFVPLFQNPAPSFNSPCTPPPSFIFKSPCRTNGDRALEKFVSGERLGRCVADYISFSGGLVIGSSSSSR